MWSKTSKKTLIPPTVSMTFVVLPRSDMQHFLKGAEDVWERQRQAGYVCFSSASGLFLSWGYGNFMIRKGYHIMRDPIRWSSSKQSKL